MMLTVMAAFVIDRSGADLDAMAIDPAALAAGVGACALAFAASAALSVRHLRRS